MSSGAGLEEDSLGATGDAVEASGTAQSFSSYFGGGSDAKYTLE